MSFMKKVVLVTGGSAGIGASTAELFAKEAAAVAIIDRNEEKLNLFAECCQKMGGNVFPIKADITKDEEIDTVVQKTVDKFGKLDVLVNNAGILRSVNMLAENFLAIFDEVLNTNLRGPVRLVHSAAPHLIKTKGNIVNVASIAGTITNRPNFIAYRTSKAALIHFTRCVALELAPHGVRVNTVSPGPVKTKIFDGIKSDSDALIEHTALHKISETEEIADLIMYVASDKARSITGSNLIIDNGSMLV